MNIIYIRTIDIEYKLQIKEVEEKLKEHEKDPFIKRKTRWIEKN